jgi:hypothetical protein
MSFESTALIILFSSFFGFSGIAIRKIPVLTSLPETVSSKRGKDLDLSKRIKERKVFGNFSSNLFLQKILTKIRILSLKTDNKTFNWLQKIKQNSQKKKINEDNDYWEEIKKATKE